MAMVNFKKGLLSALPATFAEGTFYVTTDEHALYLDVSGSERIRISDFQKVANMAALPAASAAVAPIYYIEDINCLAVHNGTEWIQVNRDTGMTSVEVTGEGNAVTAAVYTADGRKLTLTKGATFATREYVGEIPTGYTETTIVGFINKKAEEVLSQATGGSSESAASVKAALDTYMAENDAKVTQAQSDIDALELKVGDTAVATQIENAINALDKADTAVAGQYVSAVSEDNGVITVSREALPDYSNTYDAKGAAATAEANAKSYADGLAANYDAAGAAAAVDTKLTAEVARAEAAEQANAAAAKAADDKAVAAQGEIDALEAKVGDVTEGKTVVEMIADAKTAATYDDTKVKADIQANTDAISKLNDAATVEGSVDYKIAQAVAAIMENPDETMNSINELVTWCNDHAADALELSNKVSANEADIAALEGLVGSTAVATQITDAIAAALKIEGVDKYALATDLTAAIGRIAAMEAKVANWDAAEQNAKTYADGLNTAMDNRVKVLEAIDHEAYKAADTALKTEMQSYADQAEADAIASAKEYADGLAGNYDASGSAAAAQTAAQSYADQKIAALDKADSAVAGEYVSAVSEEDGVITVTRAALPVYEEVGAAAAALAEAKTYADTAETDAVSAAKSYTDTALTWGTF